MANEDINAVDQDLKDLNAALVAAAQRITDKLNSFSTTLTLTDAQQTDLNALKAEVAALGNIVPPPAP